MNLRIPAIIVATVLAVDLCHGQGEAQAIMVKQRAKVLEARNNEQQKNLGGDNPSVPGAPATPTAPAQPAQPAPPPLTPAQQALLNLNTGMAAIKGEAKPDQLESLNDALLANARGAVKPSKKLSADLAAALSSKTLTGAQRGRVSQDLVAIFNDTTMPLAQYNDVVADVPSVLKRAGVDAKLVAAVDVDLKAIAAQVRKK